MCRNIRVLYNFEPPTTEEEIRAAAIQYVRKVSGLRAPAAIDRPAFDEAVNTIALATERLVSNLKARAPVRTREGEQARARARWKLRVARLPRST
jgi:hypothetical protein